MDNGSEDDDRLLDDNYTLPRHGREDICRWSPGFWRSRNGLARRVQIHMSVFVTSQGKKNLLWPQWSRKMNQRIEPSHLSQGEGMRTVTAGIH